MAKLKELIKIFTVPKYEVLVSYHHENNQLGLERFEKLSCCMYFRIDNILELPFFISC